MLIATLSKIWNQSHAAIATHISFARTSFVYCETASTRSSSTPKRNRTTIHPAKPNSSENTLNIKSVCGSGRK